jgi:ribosome-associated protein
MSDDAYLEVNQTLRIPRSELTFRASRAGGPGGQHVNKTATRIELWWHPASSESLSPDQRSRLLARLGPRLDGDGWLRIVAAEARSQLRNREAATRRFRAAIATALRVQKPRRKTAPSKAAKAARLAEKRRRADTKLRRRPVEPDD